MEPKQRRFSVGYTIGTIIVLGTAGVLIGLFASLLVVRRTVRPLAAIANSIRAVARGEKSASIPATDVDNEIGDIARAAEVFRQTLVDADTAREAAVRAEQRPLQTARWIARPVAFLEDAQRRREEGVFAAVRIVGSDQQDAARRRMVQLLDRAVRGARRERGQEGGGQEDPVEGHRQRGRLRPADQDRAHGDEGDGEGQGEIGGPGRLRLARTLQKREQREGDVR